MNLGKVKKILIATISGEMFDDDEFHAYMMRCFNSIDASHNELDDIQMTIILTVSTSIAKTLASIRKGEHDETMTPADIQIAHDKERTIIEYIEYLTSHISDSVNSSGIENEANKEQIAQ